MGDSVVSRKGQMEEEPSEAAATAEVQSSPWVVTNNVKEVSWPPPAHQAKEKQGLNSIRSLPNLSGVVHMGAGRREIMDLEFLKSTTAHHPSHPFTKGGFQPSKIDAESKWTETVGKVFSPAAQNTGENKKPKQVLKEVDSILTISSSSSRSSYKMPPGTSRTRKCQENYVRETGAKNI